jgi:hypothetical protein
VYTMSVFVYPRASLRLYSRQPFEYIRLSTHPRGSTRTVRFTFHAAYYIFYYSANINGTTHARTRIYTHFIHGTRPSTREGRMRIISSCIRYVLQLLYKNTIGRRVLDQCSCGCTFTREPRRACIIISF